MSYYSNIRFYTNSPIGSTITEIKKYGLFFIVFDNAVQDYRKQYNCGTNIK